MERVRPVLVRIQGLLGRRCRIRQHGGLLRLGWILMDLRRGVLGGAHEVRHPHADLRQDLHRRIRHHQIRCIHQCGRRVAQRERQIQSRKIYGHDRRYGQRERHRRKAVIFRQGAKNFHA